MLNKIRLYLQLNRRELRKSIRTKYTRPLKDWAHLKLLLVYKILSKLRYAFSRKNNLRFLSVMFIVFFFFRDYAFAVEPATTWTTLDPFDAAIRMLNGVIAIVAIIAQPLIMLIGWLLTPDWTYWDIIWLRPILYKLWQLVANIVYVIFAFMLIAIAFMNIFSESKSFVLKTSLPKLIIGIIIVPFTWFIVSAVLSISTYLTASIIKLPFETIVKIQWDTDNALKNMTIPTTIVIDLTEGSGSTRAEGEATTNIFDLMESEKWAYNLLPFYAYNIFKIQNYKDISFEEWRWVIVQIYDIFKKLAFWFIFILIFSILVIAIAFALFTRMVMLWFYAIFSPFFALSFFLAWKWWKEIKKFEDILNVKAFISLAMVPVYVAWALSFWLMFLSLTMNLETWTPSSFFKENDCSDAWATNIECQQISIGTFSLKIKWKYWEWPKGKEVFDTSKWMISKVIVNCMALIILWMAVMAALWSSKITESAVAPIKSFGDQFGKLAANMPKYIPLPIPWSWGKSLSMKSTWNVMAPISNSFENAATSQWTAFWSQFTKNTNELSKEALRVKANKPSTWHEAMTNTKDLFSKWKTQDFINSSLSKEVLIENLTMLNENGWFKDKEAAAKLIKEIQTVSNATELKKKLSELDRLSEGQRYWSILWWKWIVEYWQVDDYMGTWAKELVSNPDWTPRSWKLWIETDKMTDWTLKVKIDSNSTIFVNKDQNWLKDKSDYQMLLTHLRDDVAKWTITKEDFDNWLQKINITTPDGKKKILEELDKLWLDSKEFFTLNKPADSSATEDSTKPAWWKTT